MKSDERQQFEQAKRNFINAVLRRESGAVISDKEFANAHQQYFSVPGDSQAVKKQKRENRATVYRAFKNSAQGQPTIEQGESPFEEPGERKEPVSTGDVYEDFRKKHGL